MQHALCGLLALHLLGGAAALPSETQDAELAAGIALIKEGDFEAAVPRLDAAIRSLASQPKRARELARAYVYLGVAYLDLDQELSARGKFREALKHDRRLRLSPREFSPQVIRAFEAERQALAAVPAQGKEVPPGKTPASKAPAGKGGSRKTVLLVLGAGAAAAATALLLAGGNGSPASGCQYQMSPAVQSILAAGGMGTCQVTAGKCNWHAESTEDWLQLIPPASGTGNGVVRFRALPNAEGRQRTGRVRLMEDRGVRCEIQQSASGSLTGSEGVVSWASHLDVAGGRGQVVVNGLSGRIQERGGCHGWESAAPGTNRVEAELVKGERPGTWRFQLGGAFVPGSLRAVAGEVAILTADAIVFRLAGRPGERIGFLFEARR